MTRRIIVAEVPKLYLQSIFKDLPLIKIIPLDGMYIRLELPDDEMLQRVKCDLQMWNVRVLCVNAENEAHMMYLDAEKRRGEDMEYFLVEHIVRMLIIEQCLTRLHGSVTFERIAPGDVHDNTQRFTCLGWSFATQNVLIAQQFTDNARTWVNEFFYILLHLGYLQKATVEELTAIWRGEMDEQVLTGLGNGVVGTVKDVHSIGVHPIYYVQLEKEWNGNIALWLNARQVLPTLQRLRQLHASNESNHLSLREDKGRH